MKIANIILSVFILLFAAASAVFSYFLFEKRSQFVDGWAKMAVAINKSAVELDKDSGTKKLADELTRSTLSHESYAELDSRLPKLAERAHQVVQSRNALASALYTIGNAVDAQKLPSEKSLCGLNTYDAGKDAVVNAVADTIRNRDTQYSKLSKMSKQYLKTNVDVNALKRGNSSALANLEKALSAESSRRSKYETGLQAIAGNVGRDRLNTQNYAKSVDTIVKNVSNLRTLQQKTAKDLRNTQNQLRDRENKLKSSNAKIASQAAAIKKRDGQIKDLKRALGLAPSVEVSLWKDGSADVRKNLVGKVLSVDNNYGYITIDLGKDSRVMQKVGNREVAIDPQIVKGLDLVVVDGAITDTAKFVSRVTVDEVGSKCSTANIPAESKDIQAGFMVYWIPAN